MKKLLVLGMLCFSMAAHADTPKPSVHYFTNNTVQLEANTINLNTDNKLSDLDFDFTLSMTTHLSNNVYSKVSVTKYEKDQLGYGVVVGVEEPYKDVGPYAEISYEHNYTDFKNVSKQQFNYDTGVRLHMMSGLVPYLEVDDYADSEKLFVKAGFTYTINDRFFAVSDYSFASKNVGSKIGVGLGARL